MNKEISCIKDIQDWISSLVKPNDELGKFAVCPYARFAEYQIKYSTIKDIFPLEGVKVSIFVLEDYLSLENLIERCKELNEVYVDYIFLDDHKDEHSFINGIKTNNGKYNLIICQNKKELLSAREHLKNTEYYSYWDEQMYNKIVK